MTAVAFRLQELGVDFSKVDYEKLESLQRQRNFVRKLK
jgi:hypothetical protein